MRTSLGALLCFAAVTIPGQSPPQVELATDDLRIRLDGRGQLVSVYSGSQSREYLAPGQPAPLLTIRTAGGLESPSALAFESKAGIIVLRYEASGVRVRVKALAKPTHVTFEIVGTEPAGVVDAITWGPYPMTIGATIGEIIGVVRDPAFAIGLQVLNIKTLGGYPAFDEGSDPSRSRVAQAAPWGSVLRAYSLDRSRPRRVAGWTGQFPNMPVAPIKGETVVGSAIALFGCAAGLALDRIGAIEVAERLPHPVIDGQWVKQWRDLGRSYLIAPFTESTVDDLLAYTRRANLMSLYHPEPFASWGHYGLDPKAFPNGNEGMKRAAEKAKAMGIRLGAHTLTNFINTNDAYVTPLPDPRLARTGESVLTADLDAGAREIRVASPEYFANEKANWLHTVVIGHELIRYRAVSKTAPWTLLDCERGAFGTSAAAHGKGSIVGKLVDHPYKVFFPTIELQDEIARNLARWFNETGVSHMDFDGHEGCLGSGQGDYAIERFAKVFHDTLDHPVINGTSNSEPFYWHINTYCNWGEPWYGGFRESMQEYRLQNQALFERNFVPHMLGWYRLTATTSVPEMEWMLARAAGYNAGFAMSTTLGELQQNADTPVLLDSIREWEAARRAGAFSPDQQAQLKDPRAEFHLEAAGDRSWNLYPFHAAGPFRHERAIRQPGEPTASTWTLVNPDEDQPLQFRIQASGGSGSVTRLVFELDRSLTFEIPATLNSGESLVADGTNVVRLYDAKGRQTATIDLGAPLPRLGRGSHAVSFDCSFAGDAPPVLEATFKTRGAAEPVSARR